jgi:hypothetical protein
MKITGTVIDVKKDETSMSYCVTGVKQRDAHKYKEPKHFGANGTYRIGYPTVTRYLNLVVRVEGSPHKFIDVREEVLEQNNRKKLTNAFIEEFKTFIKGKKLEFETKDHKNFKLVDAESVKI